MCHLFGIDFMDHVTHKQACNPVTDNPAPDIMPGWDGRESPGSRNIYAFIGIEFQVNIIGMVPILAYTQLHDQHIFDPIGQMQWIFWYDFSRVLVHLQLLFSEPVHYICFELMFPHH
jgi:hypothetical protein